MSFTIENIAHLIEGRIEGNPNAIITAPCKIEEGFEGGISFLSNPKYESYIYTTKASALIVPKDIVINAKVTATLIYVDNVYGALATLLNALESTEKKKGIATSAIIKSNTSIADASYVGDFTIVSEGAMIGENTTIHDQVFIGKNVRVGNNTIIYQGVKIYKDCIIGDNCIIHSNTVIGSDGFGFVPQADGTYSKLPQIGNVVIENNVEVGANTVIDRATMGSTVIKEGAKLDNLIQIAHNVVIGNNTVIAAQAGIAGSAQIGENCMIGGQVGMAGHIKVANKTMIQAKSGISSNITEEGRKLYGYPALEYHNYLKSYAHFKNLDKIVDKLRKLEKEIDQLKQN